MSRESPTIRFHKLGLSSPSIFFKNCVVFNIITKEQVVNNLGDTAILLQLKAERELP